jgi:predicted MFS family arabinose efflux permease
LISVPILSRDNPALLKSTALVGFTSLVVIAGTLLSERLVRCLIRWVWLVDMMSGLLLPVVLLVPSLRGYLPVYMVFAVLMGFSVAGTEAASMMVAVEKPTRSVLVKRLSLFNALRVVGMALGFLLGCLIAGERDALRVAASMLSLAALAQVLLSGVAWSRFRQRELVTSTFEEPPGSLRGSIIPPISPPKPPRIARGLGSLGLFVADLIVFSFWYSFIPHSLKASGEGEVHIGLYLAIQAMSHAVGQYFWKIVLMRLGELPSFFISLAGHIAMVCLIVRAGGASFTVYIAMFVLMGLLNSGTYLASTVWYYAAGYPRSRHTQVGLHQTASSLGKWLGASLAIMWMR